ncbi:MAG: hypothetical protein IJ228_06980 [Succinivibrio sp.]|nr:hypothetical protein [Succinivibrio sp.]
MANNEKTSLLQFEVLEQESPRAKVRASELCVQLNNLSLEKTLERIDVLKQLLGEFGSNLELLLNFKCLIGGNIFIGKNVHIMFNFTIMDRSRVEIGDSTFIDSDCSIYTTPFGIRNTKDGKQRNSQNLSAPVKIGNNVFIGAHSVIFGGVSIGDNAEILPCSVVTRSVPANTVYGGPAAAVHADSTPLDEAQEQGEE